MEKKEKHSKLKDLFYTELKTQGYFTLMSLSAEQAQAVFSYRTRMASYSENYRSNNGHSLCPLCLTHLDSQVFSFSCPVMKGNVSMKGKKKSYIFNDKIDIELGNTLVQIDKNRQEYINSRSLEL